MGAETNDEAAKMGGEACSHRKKCPPQGVCCSEARSPSSGPHPGWGGMLTSAQDNNLTPPLSNPIFYDLGLRALRLCRCPQRSSTDASEEIGGAPSAAAGLQAPGPGPGDRSVRSTTFRGRSSAAEQSEVFARTTASRLASGETPEDAEETLNPPLFRSDR